MTITKNQANAVIALLSVIAVLLASQLVVNLKKSPQTVADPYREALISYNVKRMMDKQFQLIAESAKIRARIKSLQDPDAMVVTLDATEQGKGAYDFYTKAIQIEDKKETIARLENNLKKVLSQMLDPKDYLANVKKQFAEDSNELP